METVIFYVRHVATFELLNWIIDLLNWIIALYMDILLTNCVHMSYIVKFSYTFLKPGALPSFINSLFVTKNHVLVS